MKKIYISLCATLLLTSCSNDLYYARKIFSKENDISILNVNVDFYAGTFSEVEVVQMSGKGINFTQAEVNRLVGTRVFIFSNANELLAYSDNKLINLVEAYKRDIIKDEDVEIIYARYCAYKNYNQSQIDYLNYLSLIYNELKVLPDGKLELTSHYHEYGSYNNCNIYLYCNYPIDNTRDTIKTIKIGEYEFKYYEEDAIKVVKNNRFYDIDDAYNNNFITIENIKDIFNMHNNLYVFDNENYCVIDC